MAVVDPCHTQLHPQLRDTLPVPSRSEALRFYAFAAAAVVLMLLLVTTVVR